MSRTIEDLPRISGGTSGRRQMPWARLVALLAAGLLAHPALASSRKKTAASHRRHHAAHAKRPRKAHKSARAEPAVAKAPDPAADSESGARHPITHSVVTPDDADPVR